MRIQKYLAIGGALLIAAPLFIQMPANAQWNSWNWNRGHDWRDNSRDDWRFRNRVNVDRQQQQILNRLNIGRTQGALTQREYDRLFQRYNRVASLEARLRAGGLSWQERMRLQNQLRVL